MREARAWRRGAACKAHHALGKNHLHLLVTNGNAIEILSRAKHVVFVKTGTLTRGTPEITATTIRDNRFSEQDCLRIAAALEINSNHPIAQIF